MSHYGTLGVGADATAGQIRDAYRQLARRHHPDRAGHDAGAMAAINEAYRVLGDPARRAVYDASWRGSAAGSGGPSAPSPAAAGPTPRPWPVVAPGPARYPWKLVIVMAVIGIAIVLAGAVLFEPVDPPPPDNLLEPGSCVALEPNGDAREVRCTGGHDLVVEALVPSDETCPAATAAHRDRQGRGTACVILPPPTT